MLQSLGTVNPEQVNSELVVQFLYFSVDSRALDPQYLMSFRTLISFSPISMRKYVRRRFR